MHLQFSGYLMTLIGFQAIDLTAISKKAAQISDSDLPLCVSNSGSKYLGISINLSYTDVFKANFYTPTCATNLKLDLQRALYLSL